jgi:hypothetical protein
MKIYQKTTTTMTRVAACKLLAESNSTWQYASDSKVHTKDPGLPLSYQQLANNAMSVESILNAKMSPRRIAGHGLDDWWRHVSG